MGKFLESSAGKATLYSIVGLAIAVAIYMAVVYLGNSAVENANTRMFIDSENGKTFPHELVAGETMPVLSPYSGKKTGYETEKCYWTKEGGIKSQPTYVLLNSTVGKAGPTFCPDCGRLVVAHNPPAEGNSHPPPLQSEYQAKAGAPDRGQR